MYQEHITLLKPYSDLVKVYYVIVRLSEECPL